MEVIFSLENIREVARQVLNVIGDRKILAMHGQMGAGKTTFTHALCDVMEVVDVVNSPTFPIINVYQNKVDKTIYHIDLYRLKDEEEAVNAGVEDCLYSGNLCIVEWPERVPGILPDDTVHIKIELHAGNKRRLSL